MAIIEVKNLSKKYLIYHESQRVSDTLREAISKSGYRLLSMLNPKHKKSIQHQNSYEEFWALNNIDFSIEPGDKVGIIGRNGAGKSTLLKIISRIVEPTVGQITIRGRIASLLEVGTGFHPDLTGRENIFLNGALLGMSHQEIKGKFDEIVAFAEIDKFLDTPVKRYSSGMYGRLGFAIAAHLETDILIVDEVLSVGDAQFQEKCLKKMNKMGANGRTILFVSHNIGAVTALCNRGIFLEKGQVVAAGDIENCVNEYMSSCPTASLSWQGDIGDEQIKIKKASIKHTGDSSKDYFCQGDMAMLEVEYEVLKPQKEWVLGFGIWNARHQIVARSRLNDLEKCQQALATPGRHRAVFHLDSSLFHEGEYLIKIDCCLSHRKPIVIDDILLKFPIYPPNVHLIKKTLGISTMVLAKQAHTSTVAKVRPNLHVTEDHCDALMSSLPDIGMLIAHADCQAAIFYDPINHVAANVHSGWRGSVQNIYEKTIHEMRKTYNSSPKELLVCISPSLGPEHSEFVNYRTELPEHLWEYQIKPNHFNFWAITKMQLLGCGILPHHIEFAGISTYSNTHDCFSYRREKVTGRNGTVIALSKR